MKTTLIILSLFICLSAFGAAGTKISDLPESTSLSTNSYFEVSDMDLTPATNRSRKISIGSLASTMTSPTNPAPNIYVTNITAITIYVSNMFVTNLYATNITAISQTISNSFVVNGSHNTLIVTQALTLQTIKTNMLATTGTGLVTNAVYGTGISWDPSTRTISTIISSALATNGSAYIIVGGATTGAANWIQLTNAYQTAKSATPHGSALSAGNRYTIFLLPGIYDAAAQFLALDTQFIDLVGLSENTGERVAVISVTDLGDTILTSSTKPISVTSANQDITLQNLCLKTTTASTESCIETTQSGFLAGFKVINVLLAYAGSGNRITQWDKSFNGTWEDVRAVSVTGSTGTRAFGASVSSSITVNGVFTRCKAGASSWGDENSVAVTLSGTFTDCEGSFASSGSGTKTLSGKFFRCVGGPNTTTMFGGTTGTLSGYFEGCKAVDGQNAWGSVMSGTMRNCGGSSPDSWAGVTGSVVGCAFALGWNGVLVMNTADSTQIINTAVESNFSVNRSLLASYWKVGRAFRWEARGKYTCTNSAPGTLVFKTKFGSTAANTGDALTLPTAGITNAGWRADGLFVCRTIGGSGTISSQSTYALDQTNGVALVSTRPSNGTTTIANNGTLTFQLSVTFSSVGSGLNAITLENLVVEPTAAN